jgi:hypothetical protein
MYVVALTADNGSNHCRGITMEGTGKKKGAGIPEMLADGL